MHPTGSDISQIHVSNVVVCEGCFVGCFNSMIYYLLRLIQASKVIFQTIFLIVKNKKGSSTTLCNNYSQV